MLNENFVYLGLLIASLGSLSYLIKTFKGQIQPNRVSFLLFAIIPLIAFSAQLAQGVGIQSLFTLLVALFPLLIFISTFLNKKAYWEITALDLILGCVSLIGILFWYITKIGNIAIAFSIVADGFALMPTLIKTYRFPRTESALPWLANSVGGGITLLTINKWTFEQYGFPLYITIGTFLVFLLAHFKIGNRQ